MKNNCLICQKKTDQIIRTKIIREGKGLWKYCKKCGLVINKDGIKREEFNNFYNKTYFKNNSLTRGKKQTPLDHFNSRLNSIKRSSKDIKKILNKKFDVLEVGAGTGELAYYLKSFVKNYECNEVNKDFSNFIQKYHKIRSSYKELINLNYKKKFDLIISINTLDHVLETSRYFEKIHSLLKPKGLFYLELPNDNQFLNSKIEKKFHNFFSQFMYQKAHFFSFSEKTLSKYIKRKGFNVVKKFCRHDYSLLNFYNWILTEKPQKNMHDATKGLPIVSSDKIFSKKINRIYDKSEKEFKKYIEKNFLGETLCFILKKE